MKYLLITLLFFCHNGWGQVPDSTWGIADTMDITNFIQPMSHQTIKFKSYAEQQAFYRNYGRFISGFDSSMLCKHIYVAVEPERVKVAKGSVILTTIGGGDTKGKSIVCLKCQHVTNQVIDYYNDTASRMPLFYGRGTNAGGHTEFGDTTYTGTIFGSDKVKRITFPPGYHTLPANDTLVVGGKVYKMLKKSISNRIALNVCVSKSGYGCITADCPHQKKKK